jgi:hypothetical protein
MELQLGDRLSDERQRVACDRALVHDRGRQDGPRARRGRQAIRYDGHPDVGRARADRGEAGDFRGGPAMMRLGRRVTLLATLYLLAFAAPGWADYRLGKLDCVMLSAEPSDAARELGITGQALQDGLRERLKAKIPKLHVREVGHMRGPTLPKRKPSAALIKWGSHGWLSRQSDAASPAGGEDCENPPSCACSGVVSNEAPGGKRFTNDRYSCSGGSLVRSVCGGLLQGGELMIAAIYACRSIHRS